MGLAHDTAGWVGAVLVLVAYVLVSVRRLSATARSFQALNIAGGVFLGSTALYRGVFPVTVVNLVWIVVGVYALAATRKRRVPATDASPPGVARTPPS